MSDHAGRRRFIGAAIDQYEAPGVAIFGIGIKRDRQRGRQIAEADFVKSERLGGQLFLAVDIDAMF